MKMGRRVTLPLPRVSRMQPSSTQNLILSDLHTVCNTVCTERYTQRMELSELLTKCTLKLSDVHALGLLEVSSTHSAWCRFTLYFKTQHCLTRQY